MKLYGLTLPWVKRNVIIFCRRAAFRFRDIRHQNLVLRGAYDNFESLVTSKVFDLGQCVKVHIVAK